MENVTVLSVFRLSVGSQRQAEDSSWLSSYRLWDNMDVKGSQKPLCNPSQKWVHTTIQISDAWMLLTCVQIRVTTLASLCLLHYFLFCLDENVNVILSDSDLINGNIAPYYWRLTKRQYWPGH